MSSVRRLRIFPVNCLAITINLIFGFPIQRVSFTFEKVRRPFDFNEFSLLHKKAPDGTSTNSTGAAAPVPLQLEKTASLSAITGNIAKALSIKQKVQLDSLLGAQLDH